MADLISYPFRVGPNGHVVTRPEDSIDYYQELLAILILTKPGERSQVPLFGVNDPTFGQVDPYDLTSKIDIFGPPVRIVSLKTQFVTDVHQNVIVEFELQNLTTTSTLEES